MKRAFGRVLAAALALGASSGCVQYNERCKGYVEDPDRIVGKIGAQAVPLDKLHARADNNAMGQMAADAFLNATYAGGVAPVIGAYNGGGVRSEGVCTTHDSLPANSLVSRGLVHEIFLFDDFVYAIKLNGQDLLDLFQASANGLSASDPSGDFLQISAGAQETINCSLDGGLPTIALSIQGTPVDPGGTYELASIDFLFQKGSALDPALVGKLDGAPQANIPKSSNLAEAFMTSKYGPESSGLVVEDRITFNNCPTP